MFSYLIWVGTVLIDVLWFRFTSICFLIDFCTVWKLRAYKEMICLPIIHHILRLPNPSKLENCLFAIFLCQKVNSELSHIIIENHFVSILFDPEVSTLKIWIRTSKVNWKFFTEVWIIRPETALPLSLKSNSYCLEIWRTQTQKNNGNYLIGEFSWKSLLRLIEGFRVRNPK